MVLSLFGGAIEWAPNLLRGIPSAPHEPAKTTSGQASSWCLPWVSIQAI